MDSETRTILDNLHAADGAVRYQALQDILAATDQPVDWAYEIWDELVADLGHRDNHRRAIAAHLLSNLARSDPAGRIFAAFPDLLALTRDKRFVTARHSLQALWKVGLAGERQRQMVVDGLASRFHDCAGEKNATLIRADIIQGLRQLYNAAPDEAIQQTALALIDSEEDSKYRKKYTAAWRRS